MEARKFKYDFFISYKHGKRDSKISGYLQRKLEGYKIPKEIKKRCGKEKITRVFRDKEELSVTVDLTLEIEEQLKNTEYLIVMCSPQSKQSQWVNREVETFLKYRGWEYVLPVLIEGEPRDSFPEILHEREMLAADVRGKTFAQIKKKCKNEILRLLAPALKCSYDELRQRSRAYASRRIAASAIGLAAVAIGFGAYAWNQSVQIQENYWQKMENQAGLLAEKSTELLENGDREAALLVALEALPESSTSEEKPWSGKAQMALENALYLYGEKSVTAPHPMHILKMDHSMKKVYAFNEERDVLISCDEKNIIYVWDVQTGTLQSRYLGFHEIDESCSAILGGTGTQVYICSNDRVQCYDYEAQKVLWETKADACSQKFSGYWDQWALSEDKERLALAGSDEVFVLGTERGELQYHHMIGLEDWTPSCVTWNPNGKELAMVDGGWSSEGALLLLDLAEDKETILNYLGLRNTADIAYKSEDVLGCVWTDINNYSLGKYFDYAPYYVAEINCRTGEVIWQTEQKTIMRDTSPEIRYVYEEEDGEVYDLTIATIGSEVIAIRDGELWAEFAYDSDIAGHVSYGLLEIHITREGVLYLTSWASRFIMNELYDTRELGLEDIYMAEGTVGHGIVAFPGFGGGSLYTYAPVQDDEFVEVENSGEALTIHYSANRKYRMSMVSSEEDSYDYFLNIWDMDSGEHIYRREFLYDYESRTGEHLENIAFIEEQYFLYNTEHQIVVCDLETLEPVLVYDHPVGELAFYSEIDQIFGVGGENPGVYFTDGSASLYFCPLSGGEASLVLTGEQYREIYLEHFGEELYGIYFTLNPTGTHLFFMCYPNQIEGIENTVFVWDLAKAEVTETFSLAYSYTDGFGLEFSADGNQVLFQNIENGLQIMHLDDYHLEMIPVAGENHQGYWFSDDDQYVYVYTYDYFLRVYDRASQKQTLNLECESAALDNLYFEGDTLYIAVRYSMSQPIMFCYRETGPGVYECFSKIYNCELIKNGNVYVRTGSDSMLCRYPHRGLDEMILMAKELLDGRELTEVERQRYSIEQ